MLRKAFLLKIVSWVILSPVYAMATQLHCQENVHAAIVRAWMSAANGTKNIEAAFLVRADGMIDFRPTDLEYRKMTLGKISADTVAIFHTHPNDGAPGLSRQDKAVADYNGLVMYVISIHGLYKYSHPTGQTLVLPAMEWANECK